MGVYMGPQRVGVLQTRACPSCIQAAVRRVLQSICETVVLVSYS